MSDDEFDQQGWRTCKFCQCKTNARQRRCCELGQEADRRNGCGLPYVSGVNERVGVVTVHVCGSKKTKLCNKCKELTSNGS